MKKLNPYKYNDYRQFFDDYLKLKSFTYKQFVEKFSMISFGFFSNIMAKNKSGKFKKTRKLGPETLVQLTKSMGFNDNESFYILLLALENDSEVLEGKYGGALKQVLRKNIKNYHKLKLLDSSNTSDLYTNTGELLKQLPDKHQKRIYKVIKQEYDIAFDSEVEMSFDFDIDNYFKQINQ
ncbi:MAG: hypothetical protein MK008_09815 [Bdellovibrionales bacterium]|nr:hypothetical protein [Bdellovibrionales bacterium]